MGATKSNAMQAKKKAPPGVGNRLTPPGAPNGGGRARPPLSPETYEAYKKELADKLAWSVGSTLRMSYSKSSTIMQWGHRTAELILTRRMGP